MKPHLQISGEPVGEVKTVADMHQRKSEMAKHADAFVALPGYNHKYMIVCVCVMKRACFIYFTGRNLTRLMNKPKSIGLGGYGTMEELLEMITWAQLGIHDKPVRYGFVLTNFLEKKKEKNQYNYDGFSDLYSLGPWFIHNFNSILENH